MSVEAWTAWGAWAQVVAVAVATVVALRQLRATAATRREEARAYVVVFFDFPEDRRPFPDLVVTNLGQTAAIDIRFSFTPSLRSSINAEIQDVGMFAAGIPTLVPGQSLSTLFDSMIERPKDWEDAYRVGVSYSDAFGDQHDDEFVLDLGPHKKTHYIDRKGLHDVHERLKGIEQEIKRMRSGSGGAMPVVVEDREAHVARKASERDEMERRWKEREAARGAALAEQEGDAD